LVTNAPPMNILFFLIVMLGLPFLMSAMRNSPWALVLAFVYTGFVGWTLGPILNFYIKEFANGPQMIMTALGSTGVIFLVLSAIALKPSRDFSHWGHFLFIGVIVVMVAFVLNYFFLKLPALQLAISAVIAFISGGYIMYQTNMIVKGGETNYVMATVVIFVSLVNIFLFILQMLSLFGGGGRR